jgi:rhamnosyltransferase
MNSAPPNYCICIPTCNPGGFAERQVLALASQSVKTGRILVIDSSSDDGSIEHYRECSAEIISISRKEFNHGGTRQMALEIVPEAEIFVFLTQDAIPVNSESVEKLLDSFVNTEIGAAYGRQLPRSGAKPIEAHARLFNYGVTDLVKQKEDIPLLGIKTSFISNSFAAYRRTALQQVGGFPRDVIFGEDTYVAARMILEGWKIAYIASAEVYHSHDYTILQEFRRYFDVGVFHASEPWLRESFGGAEGEGKRFVLSELRYLWGTSKLQIPSAAVRTVLGCRFRLIGA